MLMKMLELKCERKDLKMSKEIRSHHRQLAVPFTRAHGRIQAVGLASATAQITSTQNSPKLARFWQRVSSFK